MPQHIFFSWQSDTPTLTGRNLIERALERAIVILAADADVDPAARDLAIDRDSAGVPGSPPIVETIFNKIDRADVFLSDLTYVAERGDGRLMPNPNVLIEHGWALKAVTWRRVISVMNVAFGHPDGHPLPFDLQHFRRPILYECPEGAEEETRRSAREWLATELARALRVVFADATLHEETVPIAVAGAHPQDIALLAQVRQQLSPHLQRFLHQHNFGDSFRRDMLEPIYVLSDDWVGARYEFHDARLEAVFAEVKRLSRELGTLCAMHLHSVNQNSNMAWPRTDRDLAEGIQQSTYSAIKAMNDKASELAISIDAFERTSRDCIREAPLVPANAEPDRREEQARGLLLELANDKNCGGRPEIVSLPSVTVRAVPLIAMDLPQLDARQVSSVLRLFWPRSSMADNDLKSDGRQWWSNGPKRDVGKPNSETDWRIRFVRPGALEYEANIGVRSGDVAEVLVDGLELEASIIDTLSHFGETVAELGFSGRTLVEISFDGLENVMLKGDTPGARAIGRPQATLPPVWFDDLRACSAEALRDPFDIFWQMAGYVDGSPSARDIDATGSRAKVEMKKP